MSDNSKVYIGPGRAAKDRYMQSIQRTDMSSPSLRAVNLLCSSDLLADCEEI